MGAFLFCRTFLLSENFLDKMVGGCITIFRQKFLSHSDEKVRNPSVFHQFQVSKNVMLTRGMSNFSVEIFLCRTVKKLRRISKFG